MTGESFIYLDNAATTQVDARVVDTVRECMVEDFGNPASAHHLGVTAEKRVRDAGAQLLRAIGDDDGVGDLFWTSGGTEADAMGIIGGARRRARPGDRIVLSAIEHSAVRESAKMLEAEGFECVVVPVSPSGVIDPEEFGAACKGAAVATVMLVNNELGSVQPVSQAARAARKAEPGVHVHCDAVQALGKIPLDVFELDVDSLAFAAHKIHGPKGVGALWLRRSAKLAPLWSGGGHQKGLRSGTLNVPGIAGFGAAAEFAIEDLSERAARHYGFAETLVGAVARAGVTFKVNAGNSPRAPHIVSIALAGIPAEPLLHVLESRGVLVSAGSACSERDRKPSPVLQAIALGSDFGTLRLSFGRLTTQSEIDRAAEVLTKAIKSF